MHLTGLTERIPQRWPTHRFDEWSDRLKSICGSFNPKRYDQCDIVRGGAIVSDAGGLDLAQVANNLDCVSRDANDIRSDNVDNLFLLLQLQGSCGIEQLGRQERLDPGDCILVDSARPSVFYFGGSFSNHLSVHMPRQLLLSEKNAKIAVARKIGADDPMSTMLGALVAKLIKTDNEDARAPHLRDLLFNATRQAFSPTDAEDFNIRPDSTTGRIEIAQVLIDENLTEEWLTPQWLADRVGISLRTLQQDMSAQGTTVTTMIKVRRLNLARSRLAAMGGVEGASTIADIAFSVGFNDISYFNRCFRKLFDCSPKEMVTR